MYAIVRKSQMEKRRILSALQIKEKYCQQDVKELPKMNPCYCDNI